MSPLSTNQQKYYSSLQHKKYRNRFNRFLIEGEKMVVEFLTTTPDIYKPVKLLAVSSFISNNKAIIKKIDYQEITERELKKISSFKTPNQVVLEVEMPEEEFHPGTIRDQLSFYLEDIRDPGNLGTIIRTADWFGVEAIICSENSVDLYNPKAVQSSMGSFARVKLLRIDPLKIIEETKGFSNFQLLATQMQGENVYFNEFPEKGIIFFGNESNGLSDSIHAACDKKISIPKLSEERGPESLNLSMSVGIIMSEWSRRSIQNGN